MSAIDVAALRDFLARRTGLDLGRGGMEARLVHFVRQRLEIRELSFEGYWGQIEDPTSEELFLLTETMTVIYTWFFRDPGQFYVIEQLIRNFTPERTMGIWVAGCATGEEAYSVALVAAELGRRVEILGTDLNRSALQHAKDGRYTSASLDPVDATLRRRFIGELSGDYLVPEAVRANVKFQLGNLIGTAPRAPHGQGWDLVICRNVLIYFGQQQARRSLETLADCLAPGGTLILGASEAILDRPTSLQVAGIAGRAVLVRPRPEDIKPVAPSAARGPFTDQRAAWPPSSATIPLPRAAGVAGAPAAPIEPPAPMACVVPASRSTTNTAAGAVTTVQACLESGHAALEAGAIPAARAHYMRAIAEDSTCTDALLFAGIAHYLDGDFAQALSHLRGALCLDATLWSACFYQALCYENMGYAEDAARSYSQVVKLTSGQAKGAVEHRFLKGWRQDLLAVASQRAQLASANRDGRQQQRAIGGLPRATSRDRSG